MVLIAALIPAFQPSVSLCSSPRYNGPAVAGGPRRQSLSSCSLRVYKEGDPVLGGYSKSDREPGDFNPNRGPHGPHVTPDIVKSRMFYYYFEVEAAIQNPGNRDDWSFNQQVDRTGWLTVDFGEQRESNRIDMSLRQAADNPDEGDFAWNSKGYHYASAHGIPLEWPVSNSKTRPVKNADIVWKFVVTGHHDTNGRSDMVCAPLTFTLHLVVKFGQPSWTLQSGARN